MINLTNIEFNELVDSVNAERLENNPIKFDKETLRNLYERIIK